MAILHSKQTASKKTKSVYYSLSTTPHAYCNLSQVRQRKKKKPRLDLDVTSLDKLNLKTLSEVKNKLDKLYINGKLMSQTLQ